MREVPFEIIGNFLISKYGSNLKEGYKNLIGNKVVSVVDKVNPEKERLEFYQKHKQKYIDIVDKIGKIYRELISK